MATQARKPSVNGVMPRKPTGKAPVRKPAAKQAANGVARPAQQRAAPAANKAASVAGDYGNQQGPSGAYAIMASRLANRVAEMAESITFVEKQKPQEQPAQTAEEKKKPRKLEMRLDGSSKDSIAFSAPFLDNTLQKMLHLQNRMLTTTADLSKSDVEEKLVKEHASQSAELSRIIALICAEKARQGA
ncbi:hypothetical protein LTR37_017296 [Vermiconidia calcicola]|uniref:Uncharacterized protein n=1 Tax=Vermiconidia calcicola TaxID=1690605 RepID=A0ACC3MKD4_9PEZI|nr:hypothetical protein LTR37_017296 [Vermiconidia calcicola]